VNFNFIAILQMMFLPKISGDRLMSAAMFADVKTVLSWSNFTLNESPPPTMQTWEVNIIFNDVSLFCYSQMLFWDAQYPTE
jgi:hypothetical protein